MQAPVDELTTVGQLMGTLDYMAPEQLEDSHLVGPRADIYALAATLFRLLTGFSPFANENRKTPLQKLRALATQAAPTIRERRADLPLELAAIIDRALSRAPANRFASMNEFAAALTPWCAGHDLTQLVGQVSNLPGPSIESLSARRGSPDPAAWLDRRSPSSSRRTAEAEPHSGNLRSASAAGSGDPRRALESRLALDGQVENLPHKPRRTLLIALALLIVAALGIVITIETNKGTLIVESLREGVEVRVKKSGRMVEELELTTGPKSTRLAAGEYEIEIVGDADGLQIQNGKFVLKRGDTVVAKVTERPKGQTVVEKPKPEQIEPSVEPKPRKPIEIIDLAAKGMDTFEESNPDLIAARKVREALQKKISVGFVDLPLTECVAFLKENSALELFVDEAALNAEGIPHDASCTLNLKDVRIATALKFLLQPQHCAWTIDQGQVRITTLEKEKEEMVTRWYPVGRLLPGVRQTVERRNAEELYIQDFSGGAFGGEVDFTVAGHFAELFRDTLSHLWQARDGDGGTFEFLQNVAVVRQTWRAHADIESLLRLIEAAFVQPLTEPIEIRPAGYTAEADVATRKKLKQIVDADFEGFPLSDVAEWITFKLDVQVLLDKVALEEEGIPTDASVTLHFNGISGELLLSRVLKPLQLDYQIEEGLLIVTTAAKVKERLITKVYDIRDLLDRGLPPKAPLQAIESTTSGKWLNTHGEGGAMLLFADTLLIIRQTPGVHDEIAKFLTGLRSQLGDQPKAPRVIKTRPKTPLAVQPSQPTPNQPKPTTPATAKPTADNQPRYDGKSFDEWLAILDTERSPARLADALQALRLLHQDHQAATVAQRLLMLFRTADSSGTYGNSEKRRQLSSDVNELLAALPQAVLETASIEELKNGNARSRKWVFYSVIASQRRGPSVSENLARAVLQVSRDDDAAVRTAALNWLVQQPLASRFPNVMAGVKTRFREALSDKTPAAALSAVRGLSDSESDTPLVVETLTRLIGSPTESAGFPTEATNLQADVLRLAAVMGPRAAAAAPAIAPFLLLRDPPSPGPGFSIGSPGPGFGTIQLSMKSLAALALARMGKAAIAALPTVEEALKQFEGDPQSVVEPPQRLFGGFRGMMQMGLSTRQITFRELLIAAKARLEDRAALDPDKKPTEVKSEDTLLVQSLLKLLQTEQLLLEQHYGPGAERPEIRELDQKLKAAEEEFNELWKLYNEQRKNSPRKSPGASSDPGTKPNS